jgi:hypothetical protein
MPEAKCSSNRTIGSHPEGGTCCLLHFGLHKTGSSSIQSFLSSCDYPGILYPDLGETNQSRPLATAFRSHATKYHLNRKAQLNQATVAQRRNTTRSCLDKAFASLGNRRMVLSAEDLSLFPEEDLENFIGFVAQRAGDIKGLGYVKTVSGWLESLFQETLRNSPRLPPLTQYRPLYRPRLEKFDRLLGPSNIEVAVYQRERLSGGCVVQDFARRIGAEPPATPTRANTGLSLPAARLLAVYRQWRPFPLGAGPEMLRANKFLSEQLRTLQGPPLRFSQRLLNNFVCRTREDIDWAEQRLGFSVSETSEHDGNIDRRENLLVLQRPELDWLAKKCGLATASLPASQPDSAAKALHSLVQRARTPRRWFRVGRGLTSKLAGKHRS